jgi:ATP-dependent RNA helicase DDX51/DBP6
MAGQFYARWVPPKPATKAKQSSPVTESQRAAGSPERTKQKKHRKTELNHTPSRGDGRAASNSAEPSSEQTIPSESISESPSTSKKPKKRKRELQADDRTEREQDATPKKHKTILSKFERSSKLVKAAKNATDVDRGDDKEEDQPPEQLHGTFTISYNIIAIPDRQTEVLYA